MSFLGFPILNMSYHPGNNWLNYWVKGVDPMHIHTCLYSKPPRKQSNAPKCIWKKITLKPVHTPEVKADNILICFSAKTMVSVGVCNRQFQGTILLMVFDFEGAGRLSFVNI